MRNLGDILGSMIGDKHLGFHEGGKNSGEGQLEVNWGGVNPLEDLEGDARLGYWMSTC